MNSIMTSKYFTTTNSTNFISQEGMPPTFYTTTNNYYQQRVDEYDEEDSEEETSPATTTTTTTKDGSDFRPTFYNPFEIKHRRRTSRAQFKVLEKTFLENPKPNAAIRRWLAQKLTMTPRGVQVWFQNRRAKEKTVNSKKSSVVTKSNINKSSSPAFSSSSSESTLSLSPIVQPTMNTHLGLDYTTTINTDDMIISPPSADELSSSSPIHSVCTCNDCCQYTNSSTPMSRTISYPPQQPFYHSDTCSTSNADEEELLMTPVTPFVNDHQQQQLYDHIFINNKNNNDYWSIAATAAQQQQQLYFNNNNSQSMRRMYSHEMMFEEQQQRRYSHPIVPLGEQGSSTRFFNNHNHNPQQQEVFRRLSEPIYDHFNYQPSVAFDQQQPFVDFTTTNTRSSHQRYSM